MDPEISPETLEVLRKDPLRQALTNTALRNFQMAKLFADNKAPVTSLDYDVAGTRCITTSHDESLRIYDCERGVREHVSYSKKYGCNLAQFTAQPGCAAYASTKINDTIRYLSCDTNQYIRYFVGHKDAVTSLQRSPNQASSTLLSAALDGSVRIWDLDQVDPACTVTPTGTRSVADGGIAAAHDPSGAVVAVAVGSAEIQLLDVRELARGPFLSALIEPPGAKGAAIAGVQFIPPTGDHI
ncbi:hypothetical protein LPJ61_007060, partial [Coemansia biformis]